MPEPLETHLLAQSPEASTFFWHRLRWSAVSRWLPRDEPFTLVDVGAGAGLLQAYLQDDFPSARYRFIEPLESLRTALAARLGADSDWSDRPDVKGAQFVALLDVLEHQADDAAFLTDLAGKMDSGSTLLLTVPAVEQLWSGWDVGLGHHRRYTRKSLTRALTAGPFAVRHLRYLFPEMLPMALLRRLRAPPFAGPPAETGLEFPRLPGPVNFALLALGRASLALPSIVVPLGTSLMAVLTRR